MQVFAQIRKVKPKKLFISGDGPRRHVEGDEAIVLKLREIVHQVDWDCDLHTLFSETNSGYKGGYTRAFKWFFEHVEEGIILEDDCVPDVSFFYYTQELLERYRNDERILAISGTNFQFGHNRTQHSYYFSRYLLAWGWATWRRVWQRYDVQMKDWPQARDEGFLLPLLDERGREYWTRIFNQTYSGKIDTWDYQFIYLLWKLNGLVVSPNDNLVSNIGFRPNATNNFNPWDPLASIPALNCQISFDSSDGGRCAYKGRSLFTKSCL